MREKGNKIIRFSFDNYYYCYVNDRCSLCHKNRCHDISHRFVDYRRHRYVGCIDYCRYRYGDNRRHYFTLIIIIIRVSFVIRPMVITIVIVVIFIVIIGIIIEAVVNILIIMFVMILVFLQLLSLLQSSLSYYFS